MNTSMITINVKFNNLEKIECISQFDLKKNFTK